MDTATLLVLIAVLVMVLAYVFQPFILRTRQQTGGVLRASAAVMRRRAALLADRNRIYAAIRDLDFDYKTNKVSDGDYAAQRHLLVAQGVEVLQELDSLPALDETPADDPIEAAVVALRTGGSAPVAVASARASKKRKGKAGTLFCPKCGRPVQPGDLFCGSCGQRL